MIISNDKVKENDVVLFRLIDGTDIIGRFISQTTTELTVARPLIVHLVNDSAGKGMAIQFIPLSVIHEGDNFTFNISTVTLLPSNKVNLNLKKSYSETVSSIVRPDTGLVV